MCSCDDIYQRSLGLYWQSIYTTTCICRWKDKKFFRWSFIFYFSDKYKRCSNSLLWNAIAALYERILYMMIFFLYMMILFSLYDDTSSLLLLYDDTFLLYDDTSSLYDDNFALYDDTSSFTWWYFFGLNSNVSPPPPLYLWFL